MSNALHIGEPTCFTIETICRLTTRFSTCCQAFPSILVPSNRRNSDERVDDRLAVAVHIGEPTCFTIETICRLTTRFSTCCQAFPSILVPSNRRNSDERVDDRLAVAVHIGEPTCFTIETIRRLTTTLHNCCQAILSNLVPSNARSSTELDLARTRAACAEGNRLVSP